MIDVIAELLWWAVDGLRQVPGPVRVIVALVFLALVLAWLVGGAANAPAA